MAGAGSGASFRQIRQLLRRGTVAGPSDAQLSWSGLPGCAREGAAFEALVAAHGGMVLAVCRGVLKDPARRRGRVSRHLPGCSPARQAFAPVRRLAGGLALSRGLPGRGPRRQGGRAAGAAASGRGSTRLRPAEGMQGQKTTSREAAPRRGQPVAPAVPGDRSSWCYFDGLDSRASCGRSSRLLRGDGRQPPGAGAGLVGGEAHAAR